MHQANQVRTVAAAIAKPDPKLAIPAIADGKKGDSRLPLRMPPIGHPDEKYKIPGEGKAVFV